MPCQLVAVEASAAVAAVACEGQREAWQLDARHSTLAIHLGKRVQGYN
jgi:hypothetical protein